jgi:hypothetical protein
LLSLPARRYPDTRAQANFFAELDRRVRVLPGVTHAGLTTILPMSGINGGHEKSLIDRRAAPRICLGFNGKDLQVRFA